jgi:pimeloyl-ACP methyl ester carboxylesterase
MFIHGFLDGAAVWDDVVSALGGRDAEFVQVDLAGMGDRVEEKGPYTLDRFAADAAAVVEAIGKPVVLVGQSMGAQVAEMVAAALPRQVEALVLLTPVPLAGAGLADDAIAPFRSLGGQPAAQRALRSQLSVNLVGPRLEHLGHIGDRVKPAVVAASADAWNRGYVDGKHPSKYPGPVLIVRGEGDPFVTHELISEAVVPRFGQATTATVCHAGHWPHVEQPEGFARILGEFLDTIDSRSRRSAAQMPKEQLITADGVQSQGWTQAFAKKASEAFAQAFAPNVVLEASALARPVEGRDQVKTVMAAASKIYESLLFTHEAVNGPRHYLEWEAQAFSGMQLRGITVLTKNDEGKIVHVAIHHRPLNGLLKFSYELGQRVRESVDASHFYQVA